jgi:chemotaxis protein MotA
MLRKFRENRKGITGIVIGLVIMLYNMQDPSRIGPGMAVGMIATFYGAVSANCVFGPLAEKLSIRSREELLMKEIVIRGVMAIQSGDNPRVVEQKLRTFLPAGLREDSESGRKAA